MKRLIVTSLIATIAISGLSANSNSDALKTINNVLGQMEMPSDAPDWAKRTSFNIKVEEGFKPTYTLETVQPIHQYSKDDMIFWQLNHTYRNNNNTTNFGLGYRNIISPELMLGINSFYDYKRENEHERWSLGIEAIGQRFEFRANNYKAITNKKEVATDEWEEVLDGWDAEIGGIIFPNSKLKTYVSHSFWDAQEADNLKQTSARIEYPLNNTMIFEVKYTHDSYKQNDIDENRLTAQLNITFGAKSKSSQNLTTSTNLHDKLLIPVKRENEIVIEKSNTLTVTIGRGT